MPRPLLAVLGWAAATAAAVAVAHVGVDAVAGRVVDPLPPAVDVADRTAPPTDAPAADPGEPARSSPSDDPASERETSSPTPSAAAVEVRSYALVGGTTTLRFESGRVTVVSAEPAPGFVMDVEGDGTTEVRVEFEGQDHRSRLRGAWDGGPHDRVDEDIRDGGDDPDDGPDEPDDDDDEPDDDDHEPDDGDDDEPDDGDDD